MEQNIVKLVVIVVTLLAASLLGSRFLVEVRKARAARKPWYAPYLTLPGLLILATLTLPIVVWVITR